MSMHGVAARRRLGAAITFATAAAAAALAAASLAAPPDAHAYPYMDVSADDEAFGGAFAGSMVVEVAVRDPAIRSIGGPAVGEPSVTVDGEPLRMAQGADGSWYAYFADIDAAMAADAAAAAGPAGAGMDFGVFCSSDTDKAVLGASFAYAEAVAVARPVAGGMNGGDTGPPAECAHPIGGDLLNNVVRRAPGLSGASGGAGAAGGPAPGQIGISPDIWPVVQLYSLGGTVDVEYRGAGGGGTERAELVYDEIPNAAMSLDRGRYPAGAEVYVSISDAQLNQDPTDRDVWTFSTDPDSPAVFYMGGWDGKDAPPSVDLYPHLRTIGFEDNGVLAIDAGRTVSFKPNGLQSAATIVGVEGKSHASLVTVRETGASTSKFASHDGDGASTVWVPRDAPRGTAAVFEYNDVRMSALTGPSTATIGIGTGPGSGQQPPSLPLPPSPPSQQHQQPAPSALSTVVITDADRNTIPSKREVLSASEAGPVPSVRIGAPLTIDGAGGVWWRGESATGPSGEKGRPVPAAYSAADSGRLAVARPPSAAEPATLVIDAGYDGGDMRRLLGGGASGAPPALSSLWLNYDVRSLAGPDGQDGATIGIAPGGRPPAGVAPAAYTGQSPAEVWDASDGRGTVRVLGDHWNKRGPVAFVVHLPGGVAGAAPAPTDRAAGAATVHIDLFSFGVGGYGAGAGGKVINNAVYRIELEETGANTGVFDGTIEHVVFDGRSAADPALAASLVAYGDDVRIAASGGSGAVTVSYMDVGADGGAVGRPVAAGIDARAHAGSVYFDANSYGFGRPVTITLADPDLDTDRARVETYGVVDDASSPHVDAVALGGSLLFEVDIRGERYRRCVVDGAEHGGLAASGFALVETGPSTGVFTGAFKLPSRICSADGTGLVSPAGGRIDARYYDYAAGDGGPSVVEASPRGDPRPGGGGGGGGLAESEAVAGREQPRAQTPDDVRRIAMVKGEQMSDAELYRVVHSAAMAAGGGGGWSSPDQYGGSGGGGGSVHPAAPAWYKTVAGWWGDGRIPDAEFAASARYVLDAGLVRLPW